MKKNISLVFRMTIILLTLICGIQFQINSSYATPRADSTAPEGAYTDSGSEQKAKEEAEKQKEITIKKEDESIKSWTLEDIFKQGDNFINQGSKKEIDTPDGEKKQVDVIDPDDVKLAADSMFKALLSTGIVLTVIIGAILGIKFMVSSADEKAKVKEVMIPYICGCVVIYGAVIIWKVITDILANV